MAQIQSGATTDLWTVDPTSKAGRITLYDSSGNELIKKPSAGSYVANILIRQSATTAANTMVWSIFNTSSTIFNRIRALRLLMMFDQTATAATTKAYYLQRIATAVPSGGTAITPTKKRSGDTGAVADIRFADTGYTTTSMTTVASPFCKIAVPISVTAVIAPMPMPLHVMGERLFSPIELGQNEGIGIFLNETAAIGQGIAGYVEFDETT